MYQILTKRLEENYTNACLEWQMNIGGKKVEEGRRYGYTRDGMVFQKAAEKQIPPVFFCI